MIQSIQKIIKIGTSGGVTIPAKEMKRQNIEIGDEVEVIVRPVRDVSEDNKKLDDAAERILKKYKQDFDNLAQR